MLVFTLVSSHVGVARCGRFSFWPLWCTSWFCCLQICLLRTSGLCRLLLSLRTRCCARGSGVRRRASLPHGFSSIQLYMRGSTVDTCTAVSGSVSFRCLRCLRNTSHFLGFAGKTTSCPLYPAVTLYSACMIGLAVDTRSRVSPETLDISDGAIGLACLEVLECIESRQHRTMAFLDGLAKFLRLRARCSRRNGDVWCGRLPARWSCRVEHCRIKNGDAVVLILPARWLCRVSVGLKNPR